MSTVIYVKNAGELWFYYSRSISNKWVETNIPCTLTVIYFTSKSLSVRHTLKLEIELDCQLWPSQAIQTGK